MGSERLYRQEEWLREKYWDEGLSQREIASICDVSNSTIARHFERNDIETRCKGGGPEDKKYRNEEWLVEKYHEEELTISEVANEVGCSDGTILRWMQRLDIETRSKSEMFSGKGNPMYKGKVEFECDFCGSTNHTDENRISEHNFCGRECFGNWLSNKTGEDHHRYSRVEVECEYCGERKMVMSSLENKNGWGNFCDRECRGKWMSNNIVGENHHRYDEDSVNYYGPSWVLQRKKARKRDRFKCQMCGVDERDLGFIPHCHHRDAFKNYGVENHKEANRMDNLILLCPSCHGKWEKMPVQPLP
jgi:transposase